MGERVGRGRNQAAGWALLLAIVAVPFAVSYHDDITNASAPGGDGERAIIYIEVIRAIGDVYPLWIPYRLGGFPTLSDPDRMIWMTPLVNPAGAYVNLQFNVLLVLFAGLIGVAAGFLARQLGTSRLATALVGSLIASSYIVKTSVVNGRIGAQVMVLVVVLSLALYALFRRRGHLWAGFGCAVAIGLAFNTGAHYVFVQQAPFMFLLGWYFTDGTPLRRAWVGIRDGFVCYAVGLLAVAVFVAPITWYNLGAGASTLPDVLLSNSLPGPAQVANLFFPQNLDVNTFRRGANFPLVSVVLLPALLVLWLTRTSRRRDPVPILMVLIAANLAILLGRAWPFSALVELFEQTPLLWHIRFALAFHLPLTLGSVLLLGLAVDALPLTAPIGSRAKIALLVASLAPAALGTVFWARTGWPGAPAVLPAASFLPRLAVLLAACCAVFLFALGRRWASSAVALVVVAQFVLFPYTSTMDRVSNAVIIPESLEVMRSDPSYFRLFVQPDRAARFNGLNDIPVVNGFSLYFAPEHRRQLNNLFGQQQRWLRPHWVNPTRPNTWNPATLDQLNVKYTLTNQDPRWFADLWEVVADDGEHRLMRRNAWRPALALVDRWTVEQDLDVILADTGRPEYDFREHVFLEVEPGLREGHPRVELDSEVRLIRFEAEEVVVEVEGNKNGVLFLSEYFDSGWRVRIDGEPATMLRVNGSFRGVAVHEGSHEVRFYYAPPVVRWGALVSLFTLAAGIMLSVVHQRRRSGRREAIR